MPPVLGLILAGGLSRRMGGGDKTLLRIGGRTLLEHVTERLAPQCAAGIALSANGDPTRFAGFPGPILPDTVPGHPGPLAGILAGLDFAAKHCGEAAFVVSVPGDVPFLAPDLVVRLDEARRIAGRPIAVAASGEREHYTIALWPAALRNDLRAALTTRGERRVGGFIARHGAETVSWPAEPADPFLNINEPKDLAAADVAGSGLGD